LFRLKITFSSNHPKLEEGTISLHFSEFFLDLWQETKTSKQNSDFWFDSNLYRRLYLKIQTLIPSSKFQVDGDIPTNERSAMVMVGCKKSQVERLFILLENAVHQVVLDFNDLFNDLHI
jgi:hypothetical protein